MAVLAGSPVKSTRRRTLLLLSILAILLVTGAFLLFRDTYKPPHSCLWVFHWIPASTPLRVTTAPGSREGPMGEYLNQPPDPQLLAELQKSGVTGELRLITKFPMDPIKELGGQKHLAILLKNQPQLPTSISMIDSEIAIYSENQSGFVSSPKRAPPLGTRLGMTPDRQLNQVEFSVSFQTYYFKPLGIESGIRGFSFYMPAPLWW